MEWKIEEQKYGSPNHALYFGKCKVANVAYDGFTAKDDPRKYKTSCLLPGIKSNLGHYDCENDAKERAEFAANLWLKKFRA